MLVLPSARQSTGDRTGPTLDSDHNNSRKFKEISAKKIFFCHLFRHHDVHRME